MPRHSTYRSRGAVDTVGGEWSSGQLGIGIAVAVVFGLVCFILGYVVANVDRPLQTAEAPRGANTPTGVEMPEDPAAPPESGANREPEASTDPAPRGSSLPTASPSRPPESTNRVSPGTRPIEPLPTPRAPTPMTKSTVNIAGVTSTTKPADGASATAAPPPIIPPDGGETPVEENSSAASPEAVASAAPVPPAPTPEPANTPPPAASKPPAKAPAVTETATPAPKPPSGVPTVRRGSYGVQVAAFDSPRRSAQADEARKKLKAATGLDAEIVTSADGDWEKVIVTGFSDPEEAKGQCEMLKEKPDYASAWVVRLP